MAQRLLEANVISIIMLEGYAIFNIMLEAYAISNINSFKRPLRKFIAYRIILVLS